MLIILLLLTMQRYGLLGVYVIPHEGEIIYHKDGRGPIEIAVAYVLGQ